MKAFGRYSIKDSWLIKKETTHMTNPLKIDPRLLFAGTAPAALVTVNDVPLDLALKNKPRLAYAGTAPLRPTSKSRRKKLDAKRDYAPAATALGVVEDIRAGNTVRRSELRAAIRQIEGEHMVQSNIIDVTQQDLRAMHAQLRDRQKAKSGQRRSRERPVFEVPVSASAAVVAPDNPLPDLVREALLFVHAKVGGSIPTAAAVLAAQLPELETRLRRDGFLVT